MNPNETIEEKVQRVITESAKNSEFYQKEEKKRAEVDDRIRKLKLRIHHYKLHKRNWEVRSQNARNIVAQIELDWPLDRTWIYIDMDMFYAACEIRDRPDLVDKPVAVGDYSMI